MITSLCFIALLFTVICYICSFFVSLSLRHKREIAVVNISIISSNIPSLNNLYAYCTTHMYRLYNFLNKKKKKKNYLTTTLSREKQQTSRQSNVKTPKKSTHLQKASREEEFVFKIFKVLSR